MQARTCIWEEGGTGTRKPPLQSNAGRTLMGCDEAVEASRRNNGLCLRRTLLGVYEALGEYVRTGRRCVSRRKGAGGSMWSLLSIRMLLTLQKGALPGLIP